MRSWRSLALFLAMVCTTGTICSASAANSEAFHSAAAETFADVIAEVGPDGADVAFPGGSVAVPAGAVPDRRELRVRSAPAESSATMDSLTKPLTRAISIDLSGLQPRQPLQLTLSAGPLPSGISSDQLFVVTVPSTGEPPQLLPARYDDGRRELVATVDHLSTFWGVWLDGAAVAARFARLMIEVLNVRAPRPSTCSDEATVAVGGATADITFSDSSWRAGADPPFWGCLSNSKPGQVVISLSNNRPSAYSLQFAPGTSLTRSAPSLSSATMDLLFLVATTGRTGGQQLFTGGSSATITVPVSGHMLDAGPVIAAAIHTQMAVVAASAAQTAFLMLDLLLTRGSAKLGAAQTAVLRSRAVVDCLAGLVTRRAAAGADEVVPAIRVGLRCLRAIASQIGADLALGILAAVMSFVATFTSALDLVIRQLTGTATTAIALQARTRSAPTSQAPVTTPSGPPSESPSESPSQSPSQTRSPSQPPTSTPPLPQSRPPTSSQPPRIDPNSLVIVRQFTTDQSGTDKSLFACGETVHYRILLRNDGNSPLHTRITFRAFGPSGTMPYSYVYQQVWDIPTGLAGYYSPSTIPTTAPAGGYIFNIAIESMPDYIVDIHQNVDFSIAC